MPNSTGQTHTITTVVDLFRIVTIDNVMGLSDDIKTLLVSVAMQKEALHEAGLGDINFDANPSIQWTDDNVREVSTRAEFADGEEIGTFTVAPPKTHDDQRAE